MQKNNRIVLFLFPYPLGHAPSQRFRFEQYFGMLQEEGYTLECQSFLSESGWHVLYTKGNLIRKIVSVSNGFIRRMKLFTGPLQRASFVFIHREVAPVGPPILEWLIARVFGKKIIYDFDDSIWLPNTSDENRLISRLKWHSKVKNLCRWSHVVSAGNRYLALFAEAFASRVVINPTTVDAHHRHTPGSAASSTSGVVTIGWTGTHSTLRYLEGLEPVLQQLESAFGDRVRFLIIANREPALSLRNLVFVPWAEEREIEDLRLIDIGIMPLVEDEWSKGKCGLKALQYMSLGIPTVASPVGVNTEIIRDGVCGFLCYDPECWRKTLSRLVEDSALRVKIGTAGRSRVLADYSTESNRSSFLSLFR